MATPSIPPPFYMTKIGSPVIVVTGLDGDGGAAQYTAALGMGYAIPGIVTADVAINAQQPDPNQPVEPSIAGSDVAAELEEEDTSESKSKAKKTS